MSLNENLFLVKELINDQIIKALKFYNLQMNKARSNAIEYS